MQTILNAISSAAIIAPAAVGFTLLFALFRFANFAVGALMTLGAFACWTLNVPLGLPLWLAAPGGMAGAAAGLWLADRLAYAPLRAAGGATLLLVSIAVALVVENALRLGYGGQIKGFDLPLSRPWLLGPVRIAPEQLGVILVSAGAVAGVMLWLGLSRWGRAVRAAADDPGLAAVRGVPVGRVHAAGIAGAGALVGLGGVLAGVDLAIEPGLGWALIIPVLAAAILGGIGSPMGAVLGALLVGLAEEVTALVMSPSYKAAVGFVVIVLALLLRPHGLMGRELVRK
ncbi:MAG: branched-chain amino acid ABC transporter permease [Thermohalobaculum sp.]|nr:branched-chain amino acid ABC transporter permease [Thermohalobaculum sp.]